MLLLLGSAAAAPLQFFRIDADPLAGAQPPGERTVIAAPDDTEALILGGPTALYRSREGLHVATLLTEPVPVEGLVATDWTDGAQNFIVAEGRWADDRVLAVRAADSLEQAGLVRLDDLLTGAVLDMRYTTTDNFTGVQLYPTGAGCYLLPGPARSLIAANRMLAGVGLSLLVYDCYRPLSVQEKMWAVFPQPGFVARPTGAGSVHNRGAAVDVGLVDARGVPVELPTDHDDFTAAAAADAPGHTWAATTNRQTLQAAMRAAGFSTIRSEWWHFNGRGGTAAAMDLDFPEQDAR